MTGFPHVRKFEVFSFFISYFGSETSKERSKEQQEIKEVLKIISNKFLVSFFCFPELFKLIIGKRLQ